MKFKKMIKRLASQFITRYDVVYETEDGREKVYEMISRDKNMTTYEQLYDRKADAVVIIAHDAANERILLNKEFRMAVGQWVYNFPAGLIDPGEQPQESAKRELKEETGLDLIRITDVIGESYSAIGFSNEKNVCIVGVAEGTFAKSSSSFEEIKAGWYTKEEVRELLKTQPFAARTQSYCYLWSR